MIKTNYIKVVFIILFLFVLLMYLLNPIKVITNFIYLAIPLVPVIVSYKVQKIYGKGNVHSKAVKLIFIGFVFNFLTELTAAIFRYYNIVYEFLSPSYIFTALADIFLFIGVVYELRNYKITIKPVYKYILYIFSIIVFAVMFVYLGNWQYPIWQNIINVSFTYCSYLFVVMIALIAAMVREFRNGKLFYPWRYIAIGASVMFLGGIMLALFAHQYRMGVGFYFIATDTIWSVGYLTLGYGLFLLGDTIEETREKVFAKFNFMNKLKNL